MKGLTHTSLAGLLALLLALGSLLAAYALPLGRGADEEDHLDYALFLAHEKRLPDPGAEAVGQIQHPPLAYALLGGLWRIAYGLDEDAGAHPDATAPLEHRGRRFLGRISAYDPDQRRIDDLGLSLEQARGMEVDSKTRALYLARREVFQWLRLFAVGLGFFTLLLVALALHEVWPDRPGLTLATTALLGLTAQAAVGFATISNDPLTAFLGALAAWLALRARRRGRLTELRPAIIIAVVLGLGFLTKLHTIGVAAFIGLMVLGKRGPMPLRLRTLGILVAGPLLIAGWWHIRQWQLLGSPLALQHHLEFQPSLVRLGDWRPTTLLDYLNDLAFSFFGRFGQEKIATHPLVVLPSLALVVVGLGGLLMPSRAPGEPRRRGRRAVEGETEGPDAPPVVLPRIPTRAAAWALVLLIGLIAWANRHYYHVHGRYLLAMLVPLGIAVAGGLDRLLGRRAGPLLGLGAAFGTLVAGLTLVFVLLPRYSLDAAVMDRGSVHRHLDAGSALFDQPDAGGLTGVAPGGRVLSRGRDTYRWAPQLRPEPELRYRIEGLEPDRRYQVRVSYPRPDGADEGDLPAPSANALVGDSWALHRAQSLWPELGPLRFEIPHPVTRDGAVDLWWQNHHPLVNSVGVSQIWIEESWLGVDAAPRLAGRDVLIDLRNLDEEDSHRVVVFLERGPETLLRWPALNAEYEWVEAGDRQVLRLPLPAEAPTDHLRVRIVDTDVSPQVSLKLAHWRRDGIATGAHLDVPDLVTLRARSGPAPEGPTDSGRAETVLAELEADRLFRGPHRVAISFPAGEIRDADPRLILRATTPDGTEVPLLRVAGVESEPTYGSRLERVAWDFEPPSEGETSIRFAISTPAGEDASFDLDRLIVERLPEHPQAGHVWDVTTPN